MALPNGFVYPLLAVRALDSPVNDFLPSECVFLVVSLVDGLAVFLFKAFATKLNSLSHGGLPLIVNGFGLSPPNADMKHDAVDAFVHAKAFIILGYWNSNDEQGCSSVNVMHKTFVVLISSAESSANVLCSSKYLACFCHPIFWASRVYGTALCVRSRKAHPALAGRAKVKVSSCTSTKQ